MSCASNAHLFMSAGSREELQDPCTLCCSPAIQDDTLWQTHSYFLKLDSAFILHCSCGIYRALLAFCWLQWTEHWVGCNIYGLNKDNGKILTTGHKGRPRDHGGHQAAQQPATCPHGRGSQQHPGLHQAEHCHSRSREHPTSHFQHWTASKRTFFFFFPKSPCASCKLQNEFIYF